MYANCIFCSAALGSNESLPRFPVGRTLAFDGEKGRLWAVCPRCARWNLAPLEERWESIEDAERRFRDCRLRAQRENIGLARLADGTRLVRVGQAKQGELAAWRYGRHLLRRRRGYLLAAGAAAATGGAVATAAAIGALAVITSLPVLLWAGKGIVEVAEGTYKAVGAGANRLWHLGTDRRVLLRLSREEAAARGGERWLRKRDFRGAFLDWDAGADVPVVQVPAADGRFTRLEGPRARTALGRSLTLMNVRGASPLQIKGAVRQLSEAGSAEQWLRRAARDGLTLELPGEETAYWRRRLNHRGGGLLGELTRGRELMVLGDRSVLGSNAYLQMRAAAFEMALHEDLERRALEGELSALEEMWKQAEEIASIADRLPDVPAPTPPRLG